MFICSIFNKPCYIRPYADVTLFGGTILGLLDTGESISCIGAKTAENYLASGAPFKWLRPSVRTADGKDQNVVGFVETTIVFKENKMPITIFIIPSLDRDSFLGIDFWEFFNLVPEEFINLTSIKCRDWLK